MYHTSILIMADRTLSGSIPFQVEWTLYGTGPAIVDAFKTGEIDLAYIGLPPAVIGISQGVKIRCIAGGHIEGTVVASTREARGIDEGGTLREVLGQFRRVGVPGRGSIHDLIIRDLIDRFSLDTEVVNLPWADMVLEAFVRGEVDAVCGTPALAAGVEVYGGGRVVCPPDTFWPNNPSYGILVREGLLRERQILRSFLLVHEAASEFLRTRTEEAADRIARFVGLVERDFVYRTLSISPHYCAAITEEYMRCTMTMAQRLLQLGYIERIPEAEEVFDLTIIKEVHPGEAHYRC